MRKFIDPLPALHIAVPDVSKFPGSDYYEISLEQYHQIMHTDLATANGGLGTTLRGYRQTNGTAPQASPSYLGPVILATKNRPVRIKFTNNLPTGSGGNLFIPTDTTYMGAGMGPDGTAYTENRATLHLHGGNTPWISDGTPHQWTAPKNEVTNFKKGVSTAYVPDMWFDAAGVLLGSCQGQRTCAVAGATNNPGDGSMTFYYTNQQSGRLMFYHDHAYGITRLNVYAGEAAGYLIADPIEENALAAATVPGTVGTTPDLGHMIPLVIQDKTFVPDNGTTAGSQLAATDPTWNISTWGGFGNLWFPHVYMPNQNPIDPSGANPYGRWDYGPWFWPVQDPSTLIGLPFPCGPTFNLVCPGTPSISGTPEAFMDTPVVNGKAYPTLTVDPAAYRFHILSAGNDRTFNLGFYVADNLAVAVTNPGSGYSATTPPAVTFTSSNGVTGTGTGTAVVSTGVVTDITLTAPGSGFVTAPAVAIAAPGCVINTTTCIQATAIADISAAAGSTGGPIINIFITNGGAGYTSVPTITITPNVPGCGGAGPACAAATAVLTPAGELLGITVTGATGWTAAPTVTIGAPAAGGVQADALASVNTEVKMIPAAPPAAGALLQPCPTFTPITNVGLGMGLATTHIYNGTTNITGLPPNCLPIYSKDPGLPGPVGWPTDGRTGGVPDPTTAGPPIIQIGTEGGLLPKAVVIPSTPTSYEYNRRSITVLNIGVHGLLLGPAERADVVVDFTPWAGKTLILYNDAPTPVPAFDPRTDYYTGDPDQTATGGAPSTLPGFGPNIRTIMQIKVAATSSVVGSHSLNLPALQAALPGIYTGTLAVPNQPAPIVNPGVVVHIGDTTLINAAGPVINVNMTAGGNSYTTPPTLTFVPAGARGTGILGTGPLASIRILNGGAGYTSTPTVTIAVPAGCVINGTTCVRATATATRTGGAITLITLTNPGSGYSSAPAVTVSGGGRPTRAASLQAVWAGAPLTGVTITAGGNYGAVPLVFFSGGGGNGAQGTAVLANSFPLLPKAIQELFTLDYGRMNATLGVELPFTNFVTQTTIPYGYIDPPTEMFKDGETQLWKITHNGVDTHFMHFHLFNVQVINRVGWDGAVKPPDENELGWKDTVRMNPLEDVVVALRAMKQVVVNPTDLDVSNLPNSVRPLDVTQPLGTSAQFTGIDPNNQPAVVENDLTNFGWEYVWHCHILGHEENDMMRAMIMVVAPAAPGIPTVTQPGTSLFGPVVLSWTNSAANATGFLIERATVTGGITGAYASIGSVSNLTTFSDTTAARLTTYKYRVTAVNVAGYIGIGYPTQTAASLPTVQTGMITTR
jgi:FtsP/CotA-like multicopper oxidase with cupredoxin domain